MLARILPSLVPRRLRNRLLRPVGGSVCIVAVSLTVNLLLAAVGGIPSPLIHDEFSYVLAADTFAHGRVANPSHPLAVHFESPHILQWPSYASKYPPAQGLTLAAGQVLTGHAIFGVWLSTASACLAVAWMLRGWMRPRWALLGGLVTALHPLVLVWSQGYWGGSVAACGGALVLGALRRTAIRPRVSSSLILGAGLVILANSRPFEGLVLTLVATPLTLGMSRSGSASGTDLARVVLPLAVVLLPGALAMGYYNWRISGDPLRLPYALHEATYSMAPPFLWQAPRPEPAYRHATLRDLHAGWEWPTYVEQHTIGGFLHGAANKSATLRAAYFPFLFLGFALAAVAWLRRDRVTAWAVGNGAGFFLLLLTETWMHPHYAGPALGLAVVLVIQGIRRLRLWRWQGRRAGQALVRLGLLAGLLSLMPFGAQLAHSRDVGWQAMRARLLAGLEQQGGRHLILVRYALGHSPHAEWVYNEADIDQAPVVWARELDAEQNRVLLDYFKDRQVWLLEADVEPQRLVVYAEPTHSRERLERRGGSGSSQPAIRLDPLAGNPQ
jgi:hypothetical protein